MSAAATPNPEGWGKDDGAETQETPAKDKSKNGVEKRVAQLEKIVKHLMERHGIEADDERIG